MVYFNYTQFNNIFDYLLVIPYLFAIYYAIRIIKYILVLYIYRHDNLKIKDDCITISINKKLVTIPFNKIKMIEIQDIGIFYRVDVSYIKIVSDELTIVSYITNIFEFEYKLLNKCKIEKQKSKHFQW